MKPLASLERLKGMHEQLLALAQVTVGLLERQELEALDDAWTRRRRLFKEINSLHRRLQPLFADLARGTSQLSAADQARCRVLGEGIKQLGRQVLELDRRTEVLLTEAKQSLTEDFQRLKAGRRLIRAYNPLASVVSQGRPRFSILG